MPLLLDKRAASLAWWRVRKAPEEVRQVASPLHAAYQTQALQAALMEEQLEGMFLALQNAGLNPIVCKGWSLAREYPEAGLRPYGDIDLYVQSGEFMRTVSILKGLGPFPFPVELKSYLNDLEDHSPVDAMSRTRLVPLGAAEVRILGPEDALRHACAHLLRHGAARPMWLCDIAMLLERWGPRLDWDYYLSGDPRRTCGVLGALALACELLGAEKPARLLLEAEILSPEWMYQTVLREWGTPGDSALPPDLDLRHPSGLLHGLRDRWPNPIRATYHVGGAFNHRWRLPFQCADYGHLLARKLRHFTLPPPPSRPACHFTPSMDAELHAGTSDD